MNVPAIGTEVKTSRSRYQVTLVDTKTKMRPMQYPRIHRYFETIEARNEFVRRIETQVMRKGGVMVHEKRLDHPLFMTFKVMDASGYTGYKIVVYH